MIQDLRERSAVVAASDIATTTGRSRSTTAVRLDLKRLFDILMSSLALVAALPALFIAALAIILESPGSPIFKQKRVGLEGEVFEILKLRTMYAGTESFSFKTQLNDPRITPVGYILRKMKVDELPQLWNVLRGDMSIVGPRPLSLDESEAIIADAGFSPVHPGFFHRVKPGLIGIEQLSRNRDLSYAERFEMNHEYEKRASLLTDCSIFLKALFVCRYVCWATAVGGLFQVIIANCVLFG